MELKEFVKKVISDVVTAVDESNEAASREINLAQRSDRRTIEFDVAVSAEETTTVDGKAGVRVLSFLEAGANAGTETKNSTVSRITFGVDARATTKQQDAMMQAQLDRNRNRSADFR